MILLLLLFVRPDDIQQGERLHVPKAEETNSKSLELRLFRRSDVEKEDLQFETDCSWSPSNPDSLSTNSKVTEYYLRRGESYAVRVIWPEAFPGQPLLSLEEYAGAYLSLLLDAEPARNDFFSGEMKSECLPEIHRIELHGPFKETGKDGPKAISTGVLKISSVGHLRVAAGSSLRLQLHWKQNGRSAILFPSKCSVHLDNSGVVVNVAIVTQGRSGSTLIGRLFDSNDPGIFFLFEPLFNLSGSFENLVSLYDCSFALQQEQFNRVTWPYARRHMAWYRAIVGTKCVDVRMDDCPDMNEVQRFQVYEKCKNAKLRVIKFIRITDYKELRRLTDLRVLHLVRDPRGMLASQVANWNVKIPEAAGYVRFLCAVANELGTGHNQFPPGSFLEIRYEDFVLSPRNTLARIEAFVGRTLLPQSQSVIDFMYQDSHSVSGRQLNPYESLLKWTTILNSTDIRLINSYCNATLERYDYLP